MTWGQAYYKIFAKYLPNKVECIVENMPEQDR